MNRRHFILSSAGAMALSSRAEGATRGGLSLGFSLYGMKSLVLEAALRACAEIGYSHVELALNEGYPTAPGVFTPEARKLARAQLQSLGLEVPCMMINASLTADGPAHAKALDLIVKAGALGSELNPKQPPVLETVLGGKPATWEEQRAGMVEKLHDWAQAAEKAKTIIAIKAHVGSAVNSPERLLWLLDQVQSPAIQVTYDYSHFELQGIGMEESLQALLPRTRFIHVKDSSGNAQAFQFLLPGEGRTDYVKLFGLLKTHGYTGPVCVEVSRQVFDKPGYDPTAAARQSYAVLSTAVAQA